MYTTVVGQPYRSTYVHLNVPYTRSYSRDRNAGTCNYLRFLKYLSRTLRRYTDLQVLTFPRLHRYTRTGKTTQTQV